MVPNFQVVKNDCFVTPKTFLLFFLGLILKQKKSKGDREFSNLSVYVLYQRINRFDMHNYFNNFNLNI